MPNHHKTIVEIEKKISALSDALAHLGKGTSLKDLLLIIKQPGWTTLAEAQFAKAMLDDMKTHVSAIEKAGRQLVVAAKLVGRSR